MKNTDKDVEVLARSTSVRESLDVLRNGTYLWKVRDKGGMRGRKFYKRSYKLDLNNLSISYFPNKTLPTSGACINGQVGLSICLDEICEVRCGHGTDNFNSLAKNRNERDRSHFRVNGAEMVNINRWNCFSIVFKDGRPPLDLVAEDEVTRGHWVDALSHLVITIRSLGQQKEYELYLRKMFQTADKNKNGVLTFSECETLVKQLNIKMQVEDLNHMFNEANKKKAVKNEEEALDESEFICFYYSLLRRPEFDEIFVKYVKASSQESNGSLDRMSPAALASFLIKEQKIEMTLEECEKFIAAYEPTQDRSSLSMEGFTQFMMFSEWQEIVDTAHKNMVYQDMTQPLSHYWIASSHNTYLLGDQVTSKSSVDAYIKALKEGCRCVELDCWDGDDGEPIIYHGWTMTSKILFREVIKDAILRYAFYSSDYPVILSIENHCSLEQQDVMADHLTAILGSTLYSDIVDENLRELPSPEFLKKKVLIKAKKLPPGSGNDAEVDEDDEDPDDERDEKKKVTSKKISKKLSDLVNYIEAVHFPGFDIEGQFYQMSSFGESKAFGFCEDSEDSVKFVKYNTRQISRIYPGAKRQDSSNFKPLQPWNAGCQIVALNYQTDDKQNFLNRAKFSDNGGCGYILKPLFMRDPDANYSPVSAESRKSECRFMWVTVLSGQHIPRPDGSLEGDVIDPYVKVRIRGHPDEKPNKRKTETVRNNGFNPVWNEIFEFHIKIPSLAFLEFRVKDHSKSGSDKDIGAFCCPLSLIQPGYRRVELRNYAGMDLSPASLMVHIKFGVKNQE